MKALAIYCSIFFSTLVNQSDDKVPVDFLKDKTKLYMGLSSISLRGNQKWYQKIPYAHYDVKSVGLCYILFKPIDSAKWNRLRKEKMKSKSILEEPILAKKIISEIIDDQRKQNEYDIYAFYVKANDVTKRVDLETFVNFPNFPCEVHVYTRKNHKWIFHHKELASDFDQYIKIRYLTIMSKSK